jgi:hypothetical protein
MGFSLFGRSFAYLGIPPAKIFIGDATLAALAVFQPRALVNRWVAALVRTDPLSGFSWVLLLSIMYGFVEVVRGVVTGYNAVTALQNLVFNLYPCYLFLGLWAGIHKPDLLRKYIRITAWTAATYGLLYLFVLQKISLTIPGTDVDVLPQAGGGTFQILGILSFEKKPSRFWFPIVVCGFMLLAMQMRAEWVGAVVSTFIWGVLGKKIKQVSLVAALIVCLLGIGYVADIHLPGAASRGGEISTREIIGRGISAVDPSLAAEYSSNSRTYAGTVQWRTDWWKAIRAYVSQDAVTFLIGPGYGFPLKDLVHYTKSLDIRTPHSVFYFTLGYSGCVGVALFYALQIAILALLWRAYRVTAQPFGLAFWAAAIISGSFGNFFETPVGAIPAYLLLGLCVAPAVIGYRTDSHSSIALDTSSGVTFEQVTSSPWSTREV